MALSATPSGASHGCELCTGSRKRPRSASSAGLLDDAVPVGPHAPRSARFVEVCGHLGMLGAVALLVNGDRAPHQRLGLPEPGGVPEQPRQVVESGGHIGMFGT